MICKKCGFENDENNNFCANCGQPLTDHKIEECNTEDLSDVVKEVQQHIRRTPILNFDIPEEKDAFVEPQEQKEDHFKEEKENSSSDSVAEIPKGPSNESEKKENKPSAHWLDQLKAIPKKYLIAGFAVLFLFFLVLSSNQTKPINLNPYVHANVQGYDGFGDVSLYIDWDSLTNDYAKKLRFTSNAGDSNSLSFLENYVSLTYEQRENYSNGDVISYDLQLQNGYQSYLKNQITYSSGSYTVEGLLPTTQVDLFQDVNVIYHGVSGSATAEVEYRGDVNIHPSDFVMDQRNALSEGDTITITIPELAVERLNHEYGILPLETSKTFTVDNLGSSIDTASEIEEDNLQKAIKDGQHAVFTQIDSSKDEATEEIQSVTYEGNILLRTKKEDSDRAILYLVYAVSVRNFSGAYDETFTYHTYAKCTDVLLRPDGSLDYNADQMETPSEEVHHDSWFYWGFTSLDELTSSITSNVQKTSYYIEENIND